MLSTAINQGAKSIVSITDNFPIGNDFMFVSAITEADENHITGYYDFRYDEFFYVAHFPERAITPGTVLTEVMAQIGLVAFGMHLTGNTEMKQVRFYLTESHARFKQVVYPGQRVTVTAEKVFFRMNKLKVKAVMTNASGELVATARLSGIIVQE